MNKISYLGKLKLKKTLYWDLKLLSYDILNALKGRHLICTEREL